MKRRALDLPDKPPEIIGRTLGKFTVVERLCGRAVADETAHYIEYVSKYQNAV